MSEQVGAGVAARVRALCEECLAPAGVDGAGVSVVSRQGHRATVAVTDDLAARVEEAQFTLGEGPCVVAASSLAPLLVDDLHDQLEQWRLLWPGFTAAVEQEPLRGLFAFPVRVGGVALGALDLYRCRPGPMAPEQLGAALRTAAALVAPLLHLGFDRDGSGDDATTGTEYRLEVHAAAGMVSVQLGIGLDQALLRLRGTAYATGRSTSAVAHDVVEGRLHYDDEGPA